jgi:hypothetical protein
MPGDGVGHESPAFAAAKRYKPTKEDDVIRTMTGLALLTSALSGLALLALAPPAQAADPMFCHAYAQAAVNQVRAALAVPACAHAINGPRWAPEERIHFEWCLTQPLPAVEAERGARTGFLRGCRGM